MEKLGENTPFMVVCFLPTAPINSLMRNDYPKMRKGIEVVEDSEARTVAKALGIEREAQLLPVTTITTVIA